MYNLIYRQLSPSVHLDILGIESFVYKNNDCKYITKEINIDSIIIPYAIGICVALVKDLYENDILKGNIPSHINEIEKYLKSD